MHIVLLAVDHTTAPIAFRERLSFTSRQVPQFLQSVSQFAGECVLLSTCNRFELYAVASEPAALSQHLVRALTEARAIPLAELEQHSYTLEDEQAVAHLFGVATGLYSLVPGEAQIQGQVVDALQIAQGAGYAGPICSALFRAAIVAGKRARSETAISRNAASVSHVAVQLAHQLFPKLNDARVLLIGTGKMSELAARNLCENGAQRLVIINRTQQHASRPGAAPGRDPPHIFRIQRILARSRCRHQFHYRSARHHHRRHAGSRDAAARWSLAPPHRYCPTQRHRSGSGTNPRRSSL